MDSGKRAGQLNALYLNRVGRTAPDNLAWVLQTVARHEPTLTQHEWEDIRNELSTLAALRAGKAPVYRSDICFERPSVAEAKEVLSNFRAMIEKAIDRKRLSDQPRGNELVWSILAGRFRWEIPPASSWTKRLQYALGDILAESGHLLRSCPALKPHSTEPCGVWFLTQKKKQAYHDILCQTRDKVRKLRLKKPTKGGKAHAKKR